MRSWTCWLCWGVMSVTLYKLSWRNARRQARDYLVYFVTIVMAAALIYAFNGLVFPGRSPICRKNWLLCP